MTSSNPSQNPRKSRVSPFRWLLPWSVSLGILASLGFLVDWDELTRSVPWSEDTAPALGIATALFTASLVLKGWRFSALLTDFSGVRLRSIEWMRLGFAGNFANHVMPARTGELIYLFLASGVHRVPLQESLGALVVARVYDLACIVLLACAGAWLGPLGLPTAAKWLLASSAFLAISLLPFLPEAMRWGQGKAGSSERLMGLLSKVPGGRKLRAALFEQRLKPIARGRWRFFGRHFLTSVANWGFLNLFFYWTFRAFGADPEAWQILVGSTGAFLATLVPVNAAGNIGTLEAGWALGFALAGIPAARSLGIGVVMHVIAIVVSALLAAVSMARIAPQILGRFGQWRAAREASTPSAG